MRLQICTYKNLAPIILILTAALIDIPMAYGQETEPNQTCSAPQPLGAIALPTTVTGSLDSTPDAPDVDFFRIQGTPGDMLVIELAGETTGKGTLVDPFLGAFDSGCNLITTNDDYIGFNSRLVVNIPADGTVILGATLCCDTGFIGGGVGTYQMAFAAFHPIRSISGRLVDVVTHEALPGDTDRGAFARLWSCEGNICSEISEQPAGSDGRFLFNQTTFGQPLGVGTYQVTASASEYEQGGTAPFPVAEGEDRNLADLSLQPFPVRFSDIVPCTDIPPEGGKCRYSVRVTNRLATPLVGAGWSIVESVGTGSLTNFTRFQTAIARGVKLGSLESKIIRFSFDVPAEVSPGVLICTQAFFGDDRRDPFFNTVSARPMFCFTKQFGGSYSVLPEPQARKALRRMDSRTSTRRK